MAGKPKRRAKQKKERARIFLPAVIPPPPPEPEPTDRYGRPTLFRPEYVEMARQQCIEGATDEELADLFGVSRRTLTTWKRVHPELAEVMKLGKELANDRVERCVYEQTMGYTVTVKKAVKLRNADGSERIEEVEEEVFVPPQPQLAKFFLVNRRGDDWKDRSEKVHSGGQEIVHLTLEQVRERVAAKLQHLKDRQLGQG